MNKITRAEKYVYLCTKAWTSHHHAMMCGAGNSPWKRWEEWKKGNWVLKGENGFVYQFRGKHYKEQTRYIKIDGAKIIQRRLVRV